MPSITTLKKRYSGMTYGVTTLRKAEKGDLKKIGRSVRKLRFTYRTIQDRADHLGISNYICNQIEKGTYMGPKLVNVCDQIGYPLPSWLLSKASNEGWIS